MICPNCNHHIRGANKTKVQGQWKHKRCLFKKKPKPSLSFSERERVFASYVEKRENPVKRLIRNLKLRYGWT